jgi:hypothetical protein
MFQKFPYLYLNNLPPSLLSHHWNDLYICVVNVARPALIFKYNLQYYVLVYQYWVKFLYLTNSVSNISIYVPTKKYRIEFHSRQGENTSLQQSLK